MTETKPNPIFRLMPSLTDIAFVLPVIFLFGRLEGVRTMLGDGDTGWHIRIGEWILANGRVPKTDLFSFTRPDAPFIAWEWLWDVGAALLHDRFGLGAVVLASMLVLCVTFALLYRLVYRRCGNGIVALLMTALAASGSAIHWLARPHLITWLFIVVFLMLLERVREGRTRLLWWLPVLTVLWTNLHGGFLAGIVILFAYGAGELVQAALTVKGPEKSTALRASVPYFITAAACGVATLVNPYFYHLHQHILGYLGNTYEMQHVIEFQGANFQGGGMGYFELMLLLGVSSVIWFGVHKSFRDVVLLAGWGHMGMVVVRNSPIFMIVAAPVVGAALVEWIGWLNQAPVAGWLRKSADIVRSAWEDMAPFEQIGRVHVVGLMVLAVIGLAMKAPGAGKYLKPEYDRKAYPAAALPLLSDPALRIFSDDEWGDYLIYNLWPKGGRVYVDGRSDFYGEKFCNEYIQLLGVKWDWEQTLAKYHVDTVLLRADAALASTMKESSHWRVVFDDGGAIVFRQRTTMPDHQVSTSSSGGKGRDFTITRQTSVIGDNHVTKKGAKSL